MSNTNVHQTVVLLLYFFLAMSQYPGAQRRAQAELDTVVGPSRLPELADRPNLPYIAALITELLRWKSASPLGEFLSI